ncbi:MAG: glucuronate isomerase [Anaerolineales bacterium]|nr:MAG: glucuronate isomerase [Anaerolineales bacterium]
MTRSMWHLDPDRLFGPDPAQRSVARELFEAVAGTPLVCPHGHVDPSLFADEGATFGTPAELLVIPDHYVVRMLYSQGVSLESLGIPRLDGGPVEQDHRRVWQAFAEHFHLFRGTPSGVWLAYELAELFGVEQKLSGDTAQVIYDQIAEKLEQPEFRPRALFERFNIEVLCTTDRVTDSLAHHQSIRASGWSGDVRPTFRPDAVVDLRAAGWRDNIEALGEASGVDVTSYATFIEALEQRRAFFKEMGATATDLGVVSARTAKLSDGEADAVLQRALVGEAAPEDGHRFTAHMIIEFARMSTEDGLVMQLHVGSVRNHNQAVLGRFGSDRGCDVPAASEFIRNLRPLLDEYGNDPRLTLLMFTLDESTYARELAPLAGHYPAILLGPPWWFHDSLNGMRRYFDRVMETAGIHNTAGFNDDARAFPSIPARHDVWRRASADWVAGLVVRGIVDTDDAQEMMLDLAYRLSRRAYGLG